MSQFLTDAQMDAYGISQPVTVPGPTYLNPDYSVTPVVLDATINTESDGNPNAVSSKGAAGLGQLMPATAESLGVTNPLDPTQNLAASHKYLNEQAQRFKDIRLAWAAYNHGPTAVARLVKRFGNNYDAIKKYLPTETQNYVTKNMAYVQTHSEDGSNTPTAPAAPTGPQFLTDVQMDSYEGSGVPSHLVPKSVSSTNTGIDPASPVGALEAAGNTVLDDARSAAYDATAHLKYWNQFHQTVPAQALSQDQLASAHLMGVNNLGFLVGGIDTLENVVGMQGYPIVAMPDGKGLTTGPTLKIPLGTLEKNVQNYISERSGGKIPLDDLQKRADASADPNNPTFDPLASLVEMHAGIIQSLANPAYKHTVLLNNINMVTKARHVLADPKGYTKDQIDYANNLVNYWKANAGKGFLSGIRGLANSFADNPAGTVKSFASGLLSTPELLAIGGGTGDLGFGAKAADATATSAKAARLARIGIGTTAAEDASAAAKTIAETGVARGVRLAELSSRAKTAASRYALTARGAKAATGAATGAGINAGMDYLQQEEQKGFANNLSGAIGEGALFGVLSGLHSAKKFGGVQDALKSGKEVPYPTTGNTNVDSAHDVTYGAGNSADGTRTHVDSSMPHSVTATNISGGRVTYDPYEPIIFHEHVEGSLMHPDGGIGQVGLLKIKQLMGRYLTKENMTPKIEQDIANGVPLSYQDAHAIAQAAEHEKIHALYGVDAAEQDRVIKPYLKKAASKSKEETGVEPNTPPGLDTKPYDDMGHPEEAGPGAVSGGPTGATGGPDASNPPSENSVPFMITYGMKASLRARGYSAEEVDAMTPQEAHDILGRPVTSTSEPSNKQSPINPRTGLPANFGSPKSRYGSNPLVFENPLDSLLYTTANRATRSSAHDKFLQYLASKGLSGDELIAAQTRVKSAVKQIASKAKHNETVRIPDSSQTTNAGFFSKHKGTLAAAAVASGIGSLAASTLNKSNDPWQKKLERELVGSGLGILGTLDIFGRPIEPGLGKNEAGFIGHRAENGWSLGDEDFANKLTRGGISPEKIHAAYGMIKDPEGRWMKESSDKDMHYVSEDVARKAINAEDGIPLNEFIQGSAFQKAYPTLAKDIKVKVSLEPTNFWGKYSAKDKLITLYPHYGAGNLGDHWLGVLSHELQHVIQKHEGWPEGATPNSFIDEAAMQLGPGAARKDINDLARHMYNSTYGEEAAEISRHSRTLSDEELLARFPDFKTPAGTRILKHGNLSMQGMVKEPESLEDHLNAAGDVAEDGSVPSLKETGNSMPNEDRAVQLAREGNPTAISALYKHYYPILVRTLHGILNSKNKEDIASKLGFTPEDIASRAFTKAIKALPDFRGNSKFYTYLHAATRNLALDMIKIAGRRPDLTGLYQDGTNVERTPSALSGNPKLGIPSGTSATGLSPEAADLASQEATPEEALLNSADATQDEIISRHVSDALHEAMGNLSPIARQAIIDHDLNGMSFAEMARQAGLTEGALRSRVKQAHTALKYAMQHGEGAKYLRAGQGGFATPEAVNKLFKYGIVPFAGASAGAYLASPQHKIRGAVYGAIAGLLLGNFNAPRYIKDIRHLMGHPISPDIHELTSGFSAIRGSINEGAFGVKRRIEALVPDAGRREQLSHVLEGSSKEPLTPNEQKAISIAKNFYDQLGKAGLAAGVLKKLLPNFLNHEWLSDSGDWTKHNLHRVHKTYQAGLAAGRIPKTLDLAELVQLYGRDMGAAISSKHLFDGLSHFATDNDGHTAIMDATKAPRNYVQSGHAMFAGKLVNPDLAPVLDHIFKNPYSDIALAINALSSTVKRINFGLSMFHPFILALVHLTTQPWFTHGTILKAFKEIGQSAVGKTEMQKLYGHGGFGNGLTLAYQGGLEFTPPGHGEVVDQDVNNGIYVGLDKLESWLKQYPLVGKQMGWSVDKLAQAYHLSDKFVWENVHAGLKLQSFMSVMDQMRMNWAREVARKPGTIAPSELRMARTAAKVINDLYGGLNWRQTVEDATTRWGKMLARTVNDPAIRPAMQLAVVSMDWTESTVRAFMGIFGGGSGLGGLLHPKMAADFYRLYTLRNAIIVATAYNVLNMATVGHPIWENKDPQGNPDPFDIQLGNGDTIQPNKHFFETPNLLWDTARPLWEKGANPLQWEINKVGQIPREAIDQSLDISYLSNHAPPIKNRWEHAVKNFAPITWTSFEQRKNWDSFLTMFMKVTHHKHRTQAY